MATFCCVTGACESCIPCTSTGTTATIGVGAAAGTSQVDNSWLSGLINTVGSVATTAVKASTQQPLTSLGNGLIYNPNTGQVINTGAAALASPSGLLIIAAIVLVLVLASKKS